MDFVLIPLVAAAIAGVTLVSGFGLGTVLMPVFALFFPIEVAIAATGVVHFTNNLFRLPLVGKNADRNVVLRFGVPAMLAAFAGAALLSALVSTTPIYQYHLGPVKASVTFLKLTIAVLLALLASLELWPRYHELSFPRSLLPLGGLLSGFAGGISGMQGALRAPFLLRAGLSREQFVGTANVISTLVDATRLLVYVAGFTWMSRRQNYEALAEPRTLLLVATACVAAFFGSYLGLRMFKKMTLRGVRRLVAILLFVMSIALGAGVV